MTMNYPEIIAILARWAELNDNVRCMVLTGSAASGAEHALSDLDIELYVRNTERLEQDDTWWNELGEVLAFEKLENENEQPTRLIYYKGGKLDFTLINVTEVDSAYARPFRVILDKDKISDDFTLVANQVQFPDQESFNECVNWAGAAALMIAKAIIRNEPWSVKLRDNDLKSELLRVIEWDHILRYQGSKDVRYLGTRMRDWMDDDIQRGLEDCWASFDLNENRRALIKSHQLFTRLASRVAISAGLADFNNEAVSEEISYILEFKN